MAGIDEKGRENLKSRYLCHELLLEVAEAQSIMVQKYMLPYPYGEADIDALLPMPHSSLSSLASLYQPAVPGEGRRSQYRP